MEPIIPRQPPKKIKPIQPARAHGAMIGRPASRFTFALALLTAIGTFGLSVYFFIGFAQTDTGLWSLLSAAALCFGVGALAYMPCALIALWARQARRGGGSRQHLWLSLLLLLPWLGLSIIAIIFSALPVVYSAAALIITALLLLWPVKGLMASKASSNRNHS